MRNCRAFTLIELIVVIVLLGIMAAGAGLLISRPIEGYQDQVRRQQLVDSAEMALRKIAMDVRRALPNSIRVDTSASGWALEMVETLDGARYRDEPGGGFNTATQILDFSVGDSFFNVLGQLTNLPSLPLGGSYPYRVAIYNTNPSSIYGNAATVANPGVVSTAGFSLADDTVSGVTEQRVILGTAHQFIQQSPGQRLFIVDQPISYICDRTLGDGVLKRYSTYGYFSSHGSTDEDSDAAFTSGQSGVVVGGVTDCTIDYNAGTAQRGGLITLDLEITDQGERVRLLHQIHVDNLP